MRRYAVWTLLGLLVVAALGCEPTYRDSPSSYLAIAAYLDDGHPTVLLQPCPQDYVAWIELTQSDPVTPGPSPFDHPFDNPGVWRLVNSGQATVPAQLRLLDDPPGWTEATLQIRPVTYMLDGELYGISLRGYFNASGIPSQGHDPGGIAYLSFTMENLRSLPDGQVRIGVAQTTTRDAFISAASTFCSDPSRTGVWPS